MNKKIVVLGLGISGLGAAILAKKKGYDVFVSDKGNISEKNKKVLFNYSINWEEGKHTVKKILNAKDKKKCFEEISKIIQDWSPDRLVVGLPFYPDGSTHPLSKKCQKSGSVF